MLVIGRSTMSSVAAPAPLNTPSLRKEHHQAPAPTGSPARTGWAVPSVAAVTPLRLHGGRPDADTTGRAAGSASPAHPSQPERPTQSPSEQGNVWASGHVAEVINPELAHHQPEQHPAAALPKPVGSTASGGGRATGRFARSPFVGSSGRWGDDAVEQDIERLDREKEMRRHREFPDLKEAAQIAAPHHEEHHDPAGSAPYPDRRRFDMDRPSSRFDHFERGFHRDDDYRSPHYPPYHNDRFGRDDGYDRFDSPRRAWPSRFEAPPASVGGGGAHSRFSPSDARFDGVVARPDGGRALPSFGGGSSRAGSSHGSVASASDLDVSHRYPSPPHYSYVPEDEHQHHHEGVERSPSVSEPSVAPVLPSRPVEQPLSRREDLRSPSVERQERYHGSSVHEEPVNWRQRPKPSETQLERPVATSNAFRVASDVGRVDGAEHERKNSSLSRTSSSSSSADKPSTGTASGSSGVQPATASPQVRILKRVGAAPGGPKMLFDPKTGGMVSAEKEEAASMSRRRKQQQQQQQQQTAEKKPSVEARHPSVVTEDATVVTEETTPMTKAVATLLVGDMELPIHDVPPASFRLDAQPDGDEQPASEATMELKSDAVDESPATSVEISSFEVQNDSKKPNPRRREAAGAKPSKAAARGKPATRALERVKADEHRSRSESTDKKKKPKRENRHAASASPSVSLATVPANRDRQGEKRPLKGKRREDNTQGKQSTRVVDGDAAKKPERRTNQPRNDEATAPKREARSVVVTEKPSNRSARQARRSDKRDARGSRQQDASSTTVDAGTSLEGEKSGADNGFQTVKSRRVLLSEKKQLRQHEPLVGEDKAAASTKADGSARSRKQNVRKVEQETESKVAAVKSEASGNTEGRDVRGSRRAERQAGGEQASETPPSTGPERPRETRQRSSRGHNKEQQSSGRKSCGKRGEQSALEADAAVEPTVKPTRGKRTSDKWKPSEKTATNAADGAYNASRSVVATTDASAPSASPPSVTSGGDGGAAAVKPAGKTSGKQPRKRSSRKTYVVKATSAPALSAA